MEKVNHIKAEGHDVINLGQGNPDKPTPVNIVERLKSAADNPNNHRYPPFRGKRNLKQAAADFYKKEYGVDLDPEKHIAILFGGKAGLVELPQCLLNSGDVMLVPDPGYPDYWSGAALANAKMEMMPLMEENDFLPSYDLIHKEIADKAKLMILNYPNNPTGAVADIGFFEKTVEFAANHHICVCHDFAYGGIGFDGKNQSVSCKQRVQKTLASRSTRYRKHLIWRDGESLLQREIHLLSKRSIYCRITCM